MFNPPRSIRFHLWVWWNYTSGRWNRIILNVVSTKLQRSSHSYSWEFSHIFHSMIFFKFYSASIWSFCNWHQSMALSRWVVGPCWSLHQLSHGQLRTAHTTVQGILSKTAICGPKWLQITLNTYLCKQEVDDHSMFQTKPRSKPMQMLHCIYGRGSETGHTQGNAPFSLWVNATCLAKHFCWPGFANWTSAWLT